MLPRFSSTCSWRSVCHCPRARVSSLSSELYLQLSFEITGGQSDERGQSEEEITATMAERQHLCTGGRRWMTRQEPRWRRVVAVDGAAAAAASTDGGGQRGTTVWRRVAVASGRQTQIRHRWWEEATGCHCSLLYTLPHISPPPLPSSPTAAMVSDDDAATGGRPIALQGMSTSTAEETGREVASLSPPHQISPPPTAPPSNISISFSPALHCGRCVRRPPSR